MEKKEYMAPEMEIVEFTEQGGILQGASNGNADGGYNSGVTPPTPPDDDED